MSCVDCAQSAKAVWHCFTARCTSCMARAFARGPHFHRVRKSGRLDGEYRALLQTLGLTHDQVKAAHAADFSGSKR